MIPIQFLAEWALRSSILILSGSLLLLILRVKDPSTRLAAWTAMLCVSLAIPALTAALPKAPIAPVPIVRLAPAPIVRLAPDHTVRVAPLPIETPPQIPVAAIQPAHAAAAAVSKPLDWARAALALYAIVAFTLLLRLCFGLAITHRLLRASRATGLRNRP